MDLIYTEEKSVSRPYRDQYLAGVNALIERRRHELTKVREEFITPEKLAADPVHYKMELVSCLGWPLTEYKHNYNPNVRKSFVASDADAQIYRLEIEIFPELWFYGLLFIPYGIEGRVPLVLSLHGGQGTPELCSDLNGENNYSHMTRRAIQRGAVVFAPQTLVWASPYRENGNLPRYDRVEIDAKLKHVGGSIIALEVFALKRAVDYLSHLPECNPTKIGMVGLSYGGMYTLFTAALEPRIKAAYSSCFFNDRLKYSWPDFLSQGGAGKFLDAEISALIAPRALFVEVGGRDVLFTPNTAEDEFYRLQKFYKAQNAENNLRFKITSDGHYLDREDDGFEFLFSYLV